MISKNMHKSGLGQDMIIGTNLLDNWICIIKNDLKILDLVESILL